MIPKLGGARKDGRGRSFKTLFEYILHDKDQAGTSHRVAWAEPVNCGLGGNIRRTWYEMVLTWENRTALKRAAGVPLTGRDNDRPVLHLTLSWHPSQKPDRREMMDAALSALDWLDLAEHQAIVAAHTDEPHPHIHVAVNTVHPATGRTANLYQSKKALSAWAMHWEETHGGLIVEARTQGRIQARSAPETPPEEPPPAAPLAPAIHSPKPAGPPANDNDMELPETPDLGVTEIRRTVPYLRARFRAAAFALVLLVPFLTLLARFADARSQSQPSTARTLHNHAYPSSAWHMAHAPSRGHSASRLRPP